MKKVFTYFVLSLLLFATGNIEVSAQVTIGSGNAPAQAGLLQIKDVEPTDPSVDNTTATTGGLILPRVNLVSATTLEPFITGSPTSQQALLHVGMLVYNLSSVSGLTPGMYQWSGTEWVASSNPTPQAVSAFKIIDCAQVTVKGSYFAANSLTADNYITVPVRVTASGSYNLTASCPNGYFFQGSGYFPSTGDYTVTLYGLGTPTAAATNSLTFANYTNAVTNISNAACSPSIAVQSATLKYVINCDKQSILGKYAAGLTMDPATNIVTLGITVINSGNLNITTSTENGITFSSGVVAVTPATTSIQLIGSGTPLVEGKFYFEYTTNGENPQTCRISNNFGKAQSVVTLADCSAIIPNTQRYKNLALSDNDYITVPITVTTPGDYSIVANTTNGYSYQATGVFVNAGNYTLIMYGYGTPINTSSADLLTFTNNGIPIANTCNKSLDVSVEGVKYAINCTPTVTGTYASEVILAGTQTVTIPLSSVTVGGAVDILTSTENGVWFSSEETITPSSTFLTLVGHGAPTTSGTFTYSFTTNGQTSTPCTFNVTFGNSGGIASVTDCNLITINGTYVQSAALNTSNYITIPLDVTKIGYYNFVATTADPGFSFVASGRFTQLGPTTITLYGTGTPTTSGSGTLTIKNNGFASSCNARTINISVPTTTYGITCPTGANGTYTVGTRLTGSNTITIPVNTVGTGGAVTIATDRQNGVYFTGNATLVTNTPSTITLQGFSTPNQKGTFSFTFTTTGANVQTCVLSITFASNAGLFTSPSKSCAAILAIDPTATDGEYWIQQSASFPSSPVKTYCDMTNGGYTLVWSYSEKTAYSNATYNTASAGTNMMVNSTFQLGQEKSQNVITTDGSSIQNNTNIGLYSNYRLSLATMQNITGGALGVYRVRIAENPTDMNDAWASLNYLNITATATTGDFLTGTGASGGADMNVIGSIFGRPYLRYGCTKVFNGTTITSGCGALPFFYMLGTGYADHIDWSGTGTVTPLIPNGSGATTTGDASATLALGTNLFGFFTSDGALPSNHHFGKCISTVAPLTTITTASNTSWAAQSNCGTIAPHQHVNNASPDNGSGQAQGRVMQWFIK